MRELLFGFMLTFSMFVRSGRHLQEDQRQQREDQCLYHRHKKLKRNEYHISYGGQQESENRQHRTAREEIAEKTESEREQAGNLGHEFNQPHKELDRPLDTVREQLFELEVFA